MTIKYFKAEIAVRQTISIDVVVDNDEDAGKKAREIARERFPGAQLSSVSLHLEGETELAVGRRVKHFVFGQGEIISLVRTINGANESGFRTEIRFEDGKIKHIHLPLPKEKLEVLEDES